MRSLIPNLVLFILFLAGCGCERAEGPLRSTLELASDTAWQMKIDNGSWRAARVPGGGYNSDLQDQPFVDGRSVKEHVTYRRSLTIPHTLDKMSYSLAFGAVNHGCEIYLDDSLVGQHVGPLMPFEVELTGLVLPGESYELKVVSHPPWYYEYNVPHAFLYEEARKHPDTRPDWVTEPGWATKFSSGISRYVELRIRPVVYIRDIFVRTSVSKRSLTIDFWLSNADAEPKSLMLLTELASRDPVSWDYPGIDPKQVSIEAGETKKFSLGPVDWTMGPETYWWPNKPFMKDYRAVLHQLNVRITDQGQTVDKLNTKFGFVEWSEEQNYYTVNGIRINLISDGTPESAMSAYDCYSTSPAFLPPTDSSEGCPGTWRRFMHLGICANRIHQSTPTEYMMETADELGFILIAESPIRGCQEQKWQSMEPYLNSVREMARYGRNHPSICRYSLLNEGTTKFVPQLIDAILEVDPTRPLVFEDNQINQPAVINGTRGHAFAMLHYTEIPDPKKMITGMGEYAWHWADRKKYGPVPPAAEGGLEEFIYYGGEMRSRGIVYMAGWDFINYWPNFLEGMNHKLHAWKQSVYHKDREDGMDGWASPVVNWMRRYFHPYLILDWCIHQENGPDSDLAAWPENIPEYKPGDAIHRNLIIFNDGLQGNLFKVRWELKWDSPKGELVSTGNLDQLLIEPGFYREVELQLIAPENHALQRNLYLVLYSELNGTTVFSEDRIYFKISGPA